MKYNRKYEILKNAVLAAEVFWSKQNLKGKLAELLRYSVTSSPVSILSTVTGILFTDTSVCPTIKFMKKMG
jgi:hypothetical protein